MERIRGVSGPITGHYRVTGYSGVTTALAANAPIFSARWATTQRLMACVTRLKVSLLTLTAFTTAQEIQAQAYLASSFTASDSGGTALVPATSKNTMLQVVENTLPSQFTDIRVAAAAALTAGTRTLDTIPFLGVLATSTLASAAVADFDVQSDQRQGIILQGGGEAPGQYGTGTTNPTNAQGIVVTTGSVAQGAAGTVRYMVEFEWVEFAAFSAEGDN